LARNQRRPDDITLPMVNLSDLFANYHSMIWIALAAGLGALSVYGLFFTR
jgi:hypothetical protein